MNNTSDSIFKNSIGNQFLLPNTESELQEVLSDPSRCESLFEKIANDNN